MSIVGIIWALILVLKLAGMAFVSWSWLFVIFWPLIPFLIFLVIFGIGLLAKS